MRDLEPLRRLRLIEVRVDRARIRRPVDIDALTAVDQVEVDLARPPAARAWRPASRSIRFRSASRASASAAAWAERRLTSRAATAFPNSGWSANPHGAVA